MQEGKELGERKTGVVAKCHSLWSFIVGSWMFWGRGLPNPGRATSRLLPLYRGFLAVMLISRPEEGHQKN